MADVTFDVFLALGWSESMRHRLADLAIDPSVVCLTAIEAGGRLTVQRWDAVPDPLPAGTVAHWTRQDPSRRSRTAEAVLLVLRDGLTPYAAAKLAHVSSQAVYRALKGRPAVETGDA
jgi:hypothetical protein